MSKRKIAVVTGTRAEYGLLYWIMKALQARKDVELQLIVTGAHLSPDHGMTINKIEADGWHINAKVDMKLTSDSPVDLAHSMGLALSDIAEAFDTLKPDIAVILGDRYEMLAASSAATMLHIPIAHLRGGEMTEGAMDESIRHAITKLSYWHFAATEQYRKRVIQMGEDPMHVFTVGDPIIDDLANFSFLPRAALEKELGIKLTSPVILFTYHPETLSNISSDQQISIVIKALQQFPETTLIITGANADTGGRAINEALQIYVKTHSHALFNLSFGSERYVNIMRECDVVIGNSSSGMNQAPALGKATVNIGDRQKGRQLGISSILNCPCDTNAIASTIQQALAPEFQHNLKPTTIFGIPGEISAMIAKKLAALPLPPTPRKTFHDIKF